MKRALIAGIILGFFIAFFLPCQMLMAEENAVILFIQGNVKVKQGLDGQWSDAVKGMVLAGGDELKTGADSWAEIGLGKNRENAVRIQELTLVKLTDLGPVTINLLKGELRALVEKLSKHETFEIKTPMSVSAVRGTGWDTNTNGKKVVMDVYENNVYFSGLPKGSSSIKGSVVKSGKRAIMKDPAKPIAIKNLPAGRMKDWNEWKKDFIRRRNKEKSLGEKVKNTKQKQKTINDMIKGKQSTFEQSDQGLIDKRVESDRGGGDGDY